MHKGSLCIVMEYADGGDLEHIIKRRRGRLLSEGQIIDWFIQLCIAIKYVHNRKVLHRDLKPANIMMTSSRIVKLGDFGIAKMLDATQAMARTATGTPYYVRGDYATDNMLILHCSIVLECNSFLCLFRGFSFQFALGQRMQ